MHFKFSNRVHIQIGYCIENYSLSLYLLVSIQIVYIWLHFEKKK